MAEHMETCHTPEHTGGPMHKDLPYARYSNFLPNLPQLAINSPQSL